MGKRKRQRPTQPARKEESPKKEKWWKVPLELLGAIGVIVTVLSLWLAALPKLSIDISGSLQPHDPMSTVFFLSNDGALPIHDLHTNCHLGDVQYSHNALQDVELMNVPGSTSDILSAGHKMTLPCEHLLEIGDMPANKAEMIITVGYRPDWVWWHKYAEFPLKAEKGADGNWVWTHVPQ
jgi:hypothetical protein